MSERPEPPGAGQPDLEAALRRLAEQVEVPPQPDYATRVRARIDAGAGRRPAPDARPSWGSWKTVHPLAAAAIGLLVIVAVVLSVPASREAVADLFGLSGVQVRPLPTPAPSPRATIDEALDLGEPVSLAEARRRMPFTVALPAELGAPDTVYVRQDQGLDSVSLVYRPRSGFPPAFDTRVGLLLSEYAGSATPYFEKFVDGGSGVTRVTVNDRWPGLYFPLPQQVLVRDPRGVVHEDQPRLAAPTLVWVQGSVTYRLESRIDQARALGVAASLR
jgi:hypothetical protein